MNAQGHHAVADGRRMTGGDFARRRVALGITRLAVAQDLGVRENTVYRWETERVEMGEPERFAYTALLGRLEAGKPVS